MTSSPRPLTHTTPAGRARWRRTSPTPVNTPYSYMPWEGSQPKSTEKRSTPTRHRKKPGTPKLTRLRAEAARSQPERGRQAARIPRGRASRMASSTPVPVSSRDGPTRWASMPATGRPLR